jgi:hypothetical protein
MVARAIATAGFIATACSAAAEDVAGRYDIDGTLASGKSYSVTAEIVMTSEATCDVNWTDGTTGVCMLDGTTLSVASILHSGLPQLGIYQVAPDGTFEGVFIDNYHGKGIHREKWTPMR